MTTSRTGRFFLFFGETDSFLPLRVRIRAFPIDPENLWHNRRSFRVMPRVKRQTHQWNGAGPSDSDSSQRRSFTRAGPIAGGSLCCSCTSGSAACRFAGLARSDFTRSLTIRNAGWHKANAAIKTSRVAGLAGVSAGSCRLPLLSNSVAWGWNRHSGASSSRPRYHCMGPEWALRRRLRSTKENPLR